MNRLTPYIISTDEAYKNSQYSIPIYQRLFEWDSEKIEQLLQDLETNFFKHFDEPYYIGMLTSTGKDNDLVDGQQRFTVLSLIGIVMRKYYPQWDLFLKVQEKTRLLFSARENDKNYLYCKIFGKELITPNKKMELGIYFISEWLESAERKFDKITFCKFVFEQTSFFISELPDSYKGKDLNKYFEAMNSTGRNLESHEILKIECLSGLEGENCLSKDIATMLWNVVSQMDKKIIRRGRNDDKKTEIDVQIHKRFDDSIKFVYQNDIENALKQLNDFRNDNKQIQNDNNIKICDVSIRTEPPKPHLSDYNYHGMLSFSEFLLQVLYLQLGSPEKISVNEFFDVQKLLDTFKEKTKEWKSNNWNEFFINLLKYRLLFDYHIIQIPNIEDAEYDIEYDIDSPIKRKVRQYQSMLYAGSSSKSFYLWLNPFLLYLNNVYKKSETPNLEKILKHLKSEDDKRHPLVEVTAMNYKLSPIYWFRRLDYYIWENNESSSVKDPIIEKFKFRRGGRSIEHLHPQDDSNEKDFPIPWDKDFKDRFGNLALISSSFNSIQSNDSIGVKFARVQNQVERKELESIKLYIMYKKANHQGINWTEKLVKEHEKDMYDILKKSYNLN